MTTLHLPIGATADTLIRCICRELPDVDVTIFNRIIHDPKSDGADVIQALIRAREDVKLEWDMGGLK